MMVKAVDIVLKTIIGAGKNTTLHKSTCHDFFEDPGRMAALRAAYAQATSAAGPEAMPPASSQDAWEGRLAHQNFPKKIPWLRWLTA